jgi:peptidoglycan/LPS O-acetylase OafA/YrhL
MAQATLTTSMSSSGPTQKKTEGKRPDIQGLRALAVVAVIVDHLFDYPSGGFVGVDVFFVISGFLITGLLLKEHQRAGSISFKGFYERRVRRIMPLALLVLVATVAASWFIVTAARFQTILEDGIWSLLFAANWRYAVIGTDYMQAGGPVSPLQHFWSLAVEEQFYLVWPLLIVLVLGLGPSRLGWSHARAVRVLGLVMAALVICSLAFAIWETQTTPAVAYFSTFSRAWELGIGALIAIWAGFLAKIPQAARPVLAYGGLAGIAWSLFAITGEMPFPGPWAVVPVLSTALVIAAGCGGDARLLAPLTNRASQYIGNISYSLYLWHFPAILLIGALMPEHDVTYFVAVLAAVVIFSVASFHLLEEPVRKSSWPRKKAESGKSRAVSRHALKYWGLGALACVTGVVVTIALNQTAPVTIQAAPVENSDTTAPHAEGQTPATELAGKITVALNATTWPSLTPSVDQLSAKTKAAEWVEDGCLAGETPALPDPYANADRCVYGPDTATKTAVVLGDSMAISYVAGIRTALEPQGYKVVVFTMQQCPAFAVTVVQGNKSAHPSCDPFRKWAADKVKEMSPDLVFTTSYHIAIGNLASGATGTNALAEWQDAATATLQGLSGSARKTLVLDAPPGGKNLQKCATRVSKPSD